MSYIAIKHLHLGLVVVALLLYLLRGIWLMQDSSMLEARWTRVAPHLIYTLMVAAGAWLATLSGQWGAGWIWTKIGILLAFIGLGVLAFRRGSNLPRSRRISLWGMGVILFIMIFAVAAYHQAEISSWPPATADSHG